MTERLPVAITQGDPSGIGPEIVLKCFLAHPELSYEAVVFGHLGVFERALRWVDPEGQLQLEALSWDGVRLQGLAHLGEGAGVSASASANPNANANANASLRVPHAGKDQAGPRPVRVVNLEDWGELAQGLELLTAAGPSHDWGLRHHRELDPQVAQALSNRALPAMGRIQALSGEMAAQSIVLATQAALLHQVRAVVTAPIHKEALSLAAWPYPGHTEMLQSECARFMGRTVSELPVRMMLTHDELTVVLVSIHVSLKEAISSLSVQGVLQTLQITHESLSRSLGRAPKLALSGLNPHAGEGGLMGREEIEILTPALSQAQALGIDVVGPFSPDTVFMRARSTPEKPGEFDAVVALYHDQGLIPVKYLGLDQGVNVTLGLPLVRTSPDHGTAFDLAGTGRAREDSLWAALGVAKRLSP